MTADYKKIEVSHRLSAFQVKVPYWRLTHPLIFSTEQKNRVTIGAIPKRIAAPSRMDDPCEFTQAIPRPPPTSESAA
jgi:hypothetical protein